MKKIALSLLLTGTIYAGGMFSVGHKNISVMASTDTAYGNTYTVMGINAHYFVANNLSMGVSYQAWLGSDPSINQITIPITYHLPLPVPIRPYLGGFYSRTFMGDDGANHYTDYDSYGARVGATMQTSPHSYVSFGWVQEVTDNGVNTSSRGYPEISAGVSF